MNSRKGANNSYFGNIREGIYSSWKGLKLSLKHLFKAHKRKSSNGVGHANYFLESEGLVTLFYPTESLPVPDNGRYRLHNEMDDCIVCDKCAKVCPVDCIDIEPIKATELVGHTSDGSPIRLHAAKFDIDMAKCCFCGLCTTVCPTDCLSMTKTYDFSEFDVRDMVYHFGNLSPEEAEEKKTLLAQFQAEKLAAKEAVQEEESSTTKSRPKFKPKMKAKPVEDKSSEEKQEEESSTTKSRPKFKPKMKAKPVEDKPSEEKQEEESSPAKSRPKFKPKMKAKPVEGKPSEEKQEEESSTRKARPKFKPKMKVKPKVGPKNKSGEKESDSES